MGGDAIIGSPYCHGNNLNQKFESNICLNPETDKASCALDTAEKLLEVCEYGCENANCLSRYAVRGTKTDVVIANNAPEEITLEVTYRIFSNFFGIDSTKTQNFDVGALSEKSFKVYDNVGCSNSPCSIIIEDSQEL